MAATCESLWTGGYEDFECSGDGGVSWLAVVRWEKNEHRVVVGEIAAAQELDRLTRLKGKEKLL